VRDRHRPRGAGLGAEALTGHEPQQRSDLSPEQGASGVRDQVVHVEKAGTDKYRNQLPVSWATSIRVDAEEPHRRRDEHGPVAE
jgi:hypothetical protein